METIGLTPNEMAECLGGMTVQGVYKIIKNSNIETNVLKNRRKSIGYEGG
jgi:hypothetical protein